MHKEINIDVFMSLVTEIKQDVQEWRAVDISVEGITSKCALMPVVRQVETFFGDECRGELFVCGRAEMLALAKLGSAPDYGAIRAGIAARVTSHACRVNAGAVTDKELDGMELRLRKARSEVSNANVDEAFYNERMRRRDNRFFVVDDSATVRKILSAALGSAGVVRAFETPDDVVEAYLQDMPDVVFLDIHMPGKTTGIDVLEKIRSYDSTAFVVIQSSDATAGNVLHVKQAGASAFLGKPYNREKIFETILRCRTVKA